MSPDPVSLLLAQFQVVFIGDKTMQNWPSDSIKDLCSTVSGACINLAVKGFPPLPSNPA